MTEVVREPGTGELERETTSVLQRLVRFNTVNPPGNERPAIEYLASYLGAAGFETELLGRQEQRPNLVATLPGPPTAPLWASWAMSTRCSRTPRSGPTTRGRGTWRTDSCGAAAPST